MATFGSCEIKELIYINLIFLFLTNKDHTHTHTHTHVSVSIAHFFSKLLGLCDYIELFWTRVGRSISAFREDLVATLPLSFAVAADRSEVMEGSDEIYGCAVAGRRKEEEEERKKGRNHILLQISIFFSSSFFFQNCTVALMWVVVVVVAVVVFLSDVSAPISVVLDAPGSLKWKKVIQIQ